jgi:hypothetical protein
MKTKMFTPEFVDFMPDRLAAYVLYISIPFATVKHLCACGCGSEVVTPLGSTDWTLIYNGESVSLYPSVGSWNLPCKSHYVIWRNAVRWAPRWTEQQIETGGSRTDAQRNVSSPICLAKATPQQPRSMMTTCS